MKETGISFIGEAVRSILEDRKIQTRQIVSAPNLDALSRLERELGKPTSSDGWGVCFDNDGIGGVVSVPLPCRYGAPGDRLWVRETFNFDVRFGDQPHRLPFADLWDRINGRRRRREPIQLGERGYPGTRTVIDESASWEANPYVWALTFRRLP